MDSHCHLQDAAFDGDRSEVIERARLAGIERILVPGYDLPSSRAAVRLAADHPSFIQAAVGIHPHHAASLDPADWDELEVHAAAPGVVAIGEIGLDFFRNLSPPDVQREAFSRQLDLAARHGLPVLVHDRDAHDEIRRRLLEWAAARSGDGVIGVLHAYSGDAGMAEELVAAGFLVSFALPLAFRSAAGPRAAAAVVPRGSFLVETDSPWLAPGGASQRNEPTTALRVAAEMARLRGTTPEDVASGVRDAYDRLVAG